jgi:hypothetical protein
MGACDAGLDVVLVPDRIRRYAAPCALLLWLFGGGALRVAGRRVRPFVQLLYLIGAIVTSDLTVEFIWLVQTLEGPDG